MQIHWKGHSINVQKLPYVLFMACCAFQYFQMAIVIPMPCMLTGEISIIGTQVFCLSIGELTATQEEYIYKQHELKRLKYIIKTLYISKKITGVKCTKHTGWEKSHTDRAEEPKDLGHFWLGYIEMLGHLQLSAHWPKAMNGIDKNFAYPLQLNTE